MKPRVRDYAWATFAGLFGVCSALGFVVLIVRIVTGDVTIFYGLTSIVAGSLAAYWITVGSWRVTCWSSYDGPPVRTPQPDSD